MSGINNDLRRRLTNDAQSFAEDIIRKYLPNEMSSDTHTVSIDQPILLRRDNFKYVYSKVLSRLFRMELNMATVPVSIGIGQYLGRTIYYYTYIDRSNNYCKGFQYEDDLFISDELFNLKYPDRRESVSIICTDKDYKELTKR